MKNFRLQKNFSTVKNISSLKDFDQKDISNFVKYCGVDLYDKRSGSDLSPEVTLNSVKRGNLRLSIVEDIISKEKIIFPANNKSYNSRDYIFTGKEGRIKVEPGLDIRVTVNNGFMEFEEGDAYGVMWNILPKYHSDNSSWHYKFIRIDDNKPKPVLTVPTKSEDWREIIKAFTEYVIFLKLFTGMYFKLCIIDSIYTSPYQKSFGIPGGPLTYIPTILNLGYKYIGYPKIMGEISKKLNEISKKNIRPGIKDKLISYAKKNYKDLYLVNLYTGSCYINPQYITDVTALRNSGDPTRLRTPMDWLVKAYDDKKHIIFYSDLDNPIAIAHEIGHYLEDKDGTYGNIQRKRSYGIFNDENSKTIAYFAGFFGSVFFGDVGAMTTEIIASLSGLVTNYPTLTSEYMASYKGLQILKEIGCSEEELNIAREYYKAAFESYLAQVPGNGINASMGRIMGKATRGIFNF